MYHELKVILAFQIMGDIPLLGNISEFDATVEFLRGIGLDDKSVVLGQGSRYTPQNVFLSSTRIPIEDHPQSLLESIVKKLENFWSMRGIKGFFFIRLSSSDKCWSVTGNN